MISWLESATGVTLLDPWLLLLAPLIPLALWLRSRRGEPAALFAPAALLGGESQGTPRLPASWRARLEWAPRALIVVGLLLSLLAAARPVRRVALPGEAEGIDIVLAIDTSSSMTAKDLDPLRTRLDVARDAASRFIAARPEDRIGLVAFARYPDLLCPATKDHEALGKILAGVEPVPSEGPEDATGIGTAVALAGRVAKSGGAKSRVVILLTDGEENVASAAAPAEIAPLHAAQLLRELGVRVYTIAAGIGDRRGGAFRPIDTTQVRTLASITDGAFFEARDAGALERVYQSIDQLEKARIEQARYRFEERFPPFLAASVALMLLSRVLAATVFAVQP